MGHNKSILATIMGHNISWFFFGWPCKSLILGTSCKVSNILLGNRFTLGAHTLEFTNAYSYLGTLLDKNMSLSPLLSKPKNVISGKIYRVYSIVKIRDYITTKCALAIYTNRLYFLYFITQGLY